MRFSEVPQTTGILRIHLSVTTQIHPNTSSNYGITYNGITYIAQSV